MRLSTWTLLAVGAFALGAASWIAVRPWSSATRVLLDLSTPAEKGQASNVSSEVLLAGESPARARLYEPTGPVHQCIVVGHGVHHLGITEPRLVRFAGGLARAGAVVLTPELADLADYRITRAGADVLGGAVRYLAERCPLGDRVGLVGFSFAGGLALLGATDPGTSGHLSYVASVGGYHDLSRVLRFLLTDTVDAPEGAVHRKAHEYGAVVLLYGHLERFVPPEDLGMARDAVRAWLEEDRDRAWRLASGPHASETERIFVRLASGRLSEMQSELDAAVRAHEAELQALSPRGRLGAVPVPVYLLHGTGDSVIPPEETLWAERELEGSPHLALVTPLIEHVEVAGAPHLLDEVRLVRFMARLL